MFIFMPSTQVLDADLGGRWDDNLPDENLFVFWTSDKDEKL